MDSAEAIAKFFERAEGLGNKIGPVLFQLPPSLKADAEKLDLFLGQLPRGFRYTFEFRNTSWFEAEIYSLLSRHGAAFCIYELGESVSPMQVTADFVYIRLHGPGGPYQGRYSKEALGRWCEKFEEWARQTRDVFCYFDNDDSGFAAINARELQEMAGNFQP